MRASIILLNLVPLFVAAQNDPFWMRHTPVKCAYYRESDYRGEAQRQFYIFYANDSVIEFNVAPWEGAFQPSGLPRTTKGQIEKILELYHCDPASFNNDEIFVQWFAGSSLVWRDRSYIEADLSESGDVLSMHGITYQRITCYNRVIWAPRSHSQREAMEESEKEE